MILIDVSVHLMSQIEIDLRCALFLNLGLLKVINIRHGFSCNMQLEAIFI